MGHPDPNYHLWNLGALGHLLLKNKNDEGINNCAVKFILLCPLSGRLRVKRQIANI